MANALEQFKQPKPTHEMFDSCRNCGALQGVHENASLGEFFAVCQENHTRLKLEKCEFMQETMQYLGFDIGYGWWTPDASKANP